MMSNELELYFYCVNKIIMRLFLPLFLLFVANILLGQDSTTIKEINELVGPEFELQVNHKINCGFLKITIKIKCVDGIM